MRIYDLDDTTINSKHRQTFDARGKLDLQAWRDGCTHKNIFRDTPLPLFAEMRKDAIAGRAIIITARVMSGADYAFLEFHGIPKSTLIFSRNGESDNRPDHVLKLAAAQSLHDSGLSVSQFFDDKLKNLYAVWGVFNCECLHVLHGKARQVKFSEGAIM